MYQRDDILVYGQNGMCRVLEICTSPFDRQDTREYYVLCPCLNTDRSTIYVPVKMAEEKMRPMMDASAAKQLLDAFATIDLIQVPVEKQRRELYRRVIAEAKPEGYVSVLKTVAKRREEAMRAKRQLSGTDAEFEQKAKLFLCLELAAALGISDDEAAKTVAALLEPVPVE